MRMRSMSVPRGGMRCVDYHREATPFWLRFGWACQAVQRAMQAFEHTSLLPTFGLPRSVGVAIGYAVLACADRLQGHAAGALAVLVEPSVAEAWSGGSGMCGWLAKKGNDQASIMR